MIGATIEDQPRPLWSHVADLRRRIIRALAALGLGCAAVYPATGRVLDWLARPLGQLVFLRPLEAFDARLRLSFFLGLFAAFPLLAAMPVT
jgi:sec-independent protein translocase protein TatC